MFNILMAIDSEQKRLLSKALSLSKEKKYDLSEIVLENGYNNLSYFSKYLRENFGVKELSDAA